MQFISEGQRHLHGHTAARSRGSWALLLLPYTITFQLSVDLGNLSLAVNTYCGSGD